MRILVGVDLRLDGHEWLVDRAAWFAGLVGGTVDVLFVTSSKDHSGYMRSLEQLLAGVPEEHRGAARCESGDPVDVLVQCSREVDALVVGPREPGAIERMFKGTMATRVIRGAECAVLVPRGSAQASPGRVRLLVGVDLRHGEPAASVDEAVPWVRAVDATLDAVFVERTRLPYIADARVRAKAEREWATAREPDRRALEELLATSLEVEHRGQALLAEGEAESALVDLSHDYDLVMVGNRERPGLAGYILGSVAEHVVRHAHCDVLTLPTASRR